ncbi:MAG: OmpA family protein [Proteobacteria bacterium]|nr:OmpA family protein [Pseudomonadota bacterium]MBU1736560.1 OmpA family protein [Pseudomonadota bacterium]
MSAKVVGLALTVVLLTVGCVSKSQHQELVGRYDKLTAEKAAAEQSCAANIAGMVQQLADLDLKAEGLQKQNDDLAVRVTALTEQEALLQQKKAEAEEMRALIDRLQLDLEGQQTVITQLENTLRIEVVDKLMFRSGSAKVTGRGSKILAGIVPTLQSAADKDIFIVGHTDDLPPSRELAQKYPSNWELSAARAASIVHILTWQHKIDPARITIQGAAHYHPITVYDMKNKDFRKTNRVVEIILKPRVQ